MVLGAGFGSVVVARCEFLASAEAAAFQDIEFFRFGMPMGRVAGSRRHANQRRRATGGRIKEEHLNGDTGGHFLPLPVGSLDEREGMVRGLHGLRRLAETTKEPTP